MHGHGSSTRTLLLALCLTLGFAVVESLGGWLTGSLSLLGDAGHMLSDSLALGLAAAAARLAQRPPSSRHSYGLGRVETLAALGNAVLMLVIVVWIGWEAAQRLRNPLPIKADSAAVIALIGLFVNLGAAWLLSRGEKSLNVRAALLHVIGDLLGSVAALVALLIVHFTGWNAADPLLSLLIGGIILSSTIGLLKESVRQLLDAVPEGLSLPEIGQRIASLEGVGSVHDLHVWTIAPGRAALSAHLVVTDAARWPTILVAARHLIQTEYDIQHTTLQPELPGEQRVPLERITHRHLARPIP